MLTHTAGIGGSARDVFPGRAVKAGEGGSHPQSAGGRGTIVGRRGPIPWMGKVMGGLRTVAPLFLISAALAVQPPSLGIRMSGGRVEVGLGSEPVPPVAGTRYRVQLESSPDLRGWLAEGVSVPGSAGVMLPFSGDGSFRFFRVQSRVEASDVPADRKSTRLNSSH